MANVTLAIDDDLLRSARKVAIDRDTTVNQLVREFLDNLVRQASGQEAAAERLLRMMDEKPLSVGPRTWGRDEIYER